MKKNFPITGKEVSYGDDANILSTTNPKGVITYINGDFLEISGFTQEELIGSSHNIVRHPEMPPAAFEDLWKTLKAGNSWMGMVKNRCKNGDHYWVDAFATPITQDGETTEYQSVRSKPAREHVARADAVYKQLNAGSMPLAMRIPTLKLSTKLSLAMAAVLLIVLAAGVAMDELSLGMAGASFVLGSLLAFVACLTLTRPLYAAVRRAEEVSVNPLAQYIYTGRTDEAGQLLYAMKMLCYTKKAVLGRIDDSSITLMRNAEKLTESVESTSQGIQQQQMETDQVATAVNEMSASIQEVAQNAQLTADAATHANNQADEGRRVVGQTTQTINHLASEIQQAAEVIHQLEEDSTNITKVLDVIKGIAEQTNLLALNAAIEAARAGEQGRGFAVVADEVRTLASRTQESTREIQAMIEKLQHAAEQAVSVMERSRNQAQGSVAQADQAAQALSSITDAVRRIMDMSTQIATAVEEQSTVADEINRSIISIRQVAENTATESRETENASQNLAHLADGLEHLVKQF